jgi:UDP-3-O-[3-hydroxymyristoyl] glucosamine N-acyltransferase
VSRKKEYTLAEIAEFIGSKVIGDCNAVVSNIATLESATNDSISFLSNKKYHKYIKTTLANAVIPIK